MHRSDPRRVLFPALIAALSSAPLAAQPAPDGEPGSPHLREHLGRVVGGEWVSRDDPADSLGVFELVRSYEWVAGGAAIRGLQWKEYEDGLRLPVSEGLYAWDDARATIVHWNVMAGGGVIDGAYTSLEPRTLVLEFTFSSPVNSLSSRWRAEERFEPSGAFVEQAWVRQRGEWREASTNRFERRR